MASFLWRERLKVSVSEMSRAAALDCARDFGAFVSAALDGQYSGDRRSLIDAEIEWLFVRYAPVVLLWDGLPFASTDFVLDGEVTIAQPITRECFDALPISLAQQWADAAQEANEFLAAHFLSRAETVARAVKALLTMPNSSAPEPANGQSSAPTGEMS